jgi:hypothetical protein
MDGGDVGEIGKAELQLTTKIVAVASIGKVTEQPGSS